MGDLDGGRILDSVATADGAVAINGVDIGAIAAGGGAAEMARVINLETASTGVTADAYNVVEGQSGTNVTGITSGLQITIGNGTAVTLAATSSMENLAETINRDVEGLKATVGEDGQLILNNDSGETITIAGAGATSGLENGTFKGYLGLTSQNAEPIGVDLGTNGVATETKNLGFMVTNGSAVLGETPTGGAINEADAITINGVPLISSGAALADQVNAINKLTEETGVIATISGTEILLTAADDGDIVVASHAPTEAAKATALDKLGMIDVGGTSVTELGLSVTTSKNAVSSLDKIDVALDKISDSRANLGAIQNRLSSTISNLENVSQNLSASNSRIQDADFAAETSKMSKAQILQQAGTSMLSQANASSQNVLSLLQG
ncbi:flagellin [Psychromonas sp. MME2]|uniref:flagellin n=1 Tax=Psychromonas sp. MME2 TaxID=3231033 RepID=UPI00339BB627